MAATNWLTADATFLESAGAAASPANTAAAAIRVDAALVGIRGGLLNGGAEALHRRQARRLQPVNRQVRRRWVGVGHTGHAAEQQRGR